MFLSRICILCLGVWRPPPPPSGGDHYSLGWTPITMPRIDYSQFNGLFYVCLPTSCSGFIIRLHIQYIMGPFSNMFASPGFVLCNIVNPASPLGSTPISRTIDHTALEKKLYVAGKPRCYTN